VVKPPLKAFSLEDLFGSSLRVFGKVEQQKFFVTSKCPLKRFQRICDINNSHQMFDDMEDFS